MMEKIDDVLAYHVGDYCFEYHRPDTPFNEYIIKFLQEALAGQITNENIVQLHALMSESFKTFYKPDELLEVVDEHVWCIIYRVIDYKKRVFSNMKPIIEDLIARSDDQYFIEEAEDHLREYFGK
jgi:hypothetical protein